MTKPGFFTRFTSRASAILGRGWVFVTALGIVLAWGVSGPIFGFGDTWQLVINTGTTVVTFLMVFIIQNTQNRDNLALNLKLDEILKHLDLDESELLGAEDQSDEALEEQKDQVQNGES